MLKDAENKTTQRNTKQRRLIYSEVMSRCDHPTAEEIFQAVRRKDEKISRGTVYRNLNLLSENGEITHVWVPGSDRYDSTLDRHYHIYCEKCGKVADAPFAYDSARDDEIAAKTGFRIERHRTVFQGICPECRAKQ